MKTTLIFLLSLVGFTSMSQNLPTGFETVAYEGFSYTNGQDLINVGGGTGWTSNWQQFYLRKHISARTNSYVYEGLTTTGGKATYDNTCHGYSNGNWCNQISSSGRKLTPTTEGVLYLQFLADLGSHVGGGTPHVRLDFNGSTTVVLGKEGDGHNWVLYDSNTGTSASTNISGYSTVRLVIVRFDYTNNTMRMYIDPNLSTFDYSNPSGHNAEISGISIPYFDEIGPMFRSNGTPGIDEIHVFKESSETFTNSSGNGQWATASNWASGSVPTTSSANVTISSGQTIEVGSDDAGTVSGTANENQTLTITAPNGSTFTSVDFASYGTPTSSAGDFVIGSCHATNSQSILESYLIGNTGSISIQASNGVFGDPCSGVVKRLYVKATYGSENSTTALASSITIDSGGSLTIAKNSDLTLSGDFTNNGTVTLNSDADEFASIIVQGSSSGNIVYNRYVNTVGSSEWDLIGAPTDGLSISSFVTTNSTPLATSGSNYAVGVYDNSDNSWTNYTSSTVGAENFDIGRGYQMATSSGATMAFTGTVATTDQTQSIINNAGNGGRRWNLVANPYPSYLNANTNAHASNNFLSVNSGVIDSNFSAIYGYDADGSGYTIYNNTSAATYIAPGQAFFVAAASSSATNLSFTEAMQTTNGGDDFIAGRLANTSSELYLKLYEGENLVGDTKFYFDNNLSLGLDPGYDAGAYNQSSALASRLAEDDQGVNMGINAMGIDSFGQTTIPIVVNTEAGTSFRISLEDLTIPESVEVFLEDTETQNFTNLRTEDFTLNPQSELSGMGRFYLRLGNTSLGGSDVEESYISIYNPMDKDCITIEGLASIQKANVRLYNIIGQEILSKTLQTGLSTQNISTAGLTTGVYIIKLEVDSTLISKKIVIN